MLIFQQLLVLAWAYVALATPIVEQGATSILGSIKKPRQVLGGASISTNGNPNPNWFNTPYIGLTPSDNLGNSIDDNIGKIIHKPYNPPYWQRPNLKRTSYVFNATAGNNVVVYFGQTPGTDTVAGLATQCNDPAVDIVILSFIRYANDSTGSGYPQTTFGTACGSVPTASMIAHAPGLQYCTRYIPQIQTCQSLGKKIFVSIGGSTSSISLNTPAQADSFAIMLWNLFGGGTDPLYGTAVRPFGSLLVDGFDLDNEAADQGTNYAEFAIKMRSLFATQTTKKYYLSATCTCDWPNAIANIPPAYMWQSDFLWVRFYNNQKCNANTFYFFPGYTHNNLNPGGLNYWTSWTNSSGPKIYIGIEGSQTTASGYTPPDNFGPLVLLAIKNETNLGGVMFWDGSTAHATMNLAGNLTFVQVAKAALNNITSY